MGITHTFFGGKIIFSGKANRGAFGAILWPMYIYKALPLYPGFGFTFSKAAGGKIIARENPYQHGLCAQQTALLRAEDFHPSTSCATPWPTTDDPLQPPFHNSYLPEETERVPG